MESNLQTSKESLLREIDRRVEDRIIEKSNADLLKKLIVQAATLDDAIAISSLGTTYKRTGFHFDKRLEKKESNIKYFKKDSIHSFYERDYGIPNKLIIGDNYDALINLLIQYRRKIDVIYIDPPYAKDSLGEFAHTNYENTLSRDNLLSMLFPRLLLAKQLLSDDGVIFCSIDDRNQAYVKSLFDEVFGESRFLFCVPRITKKGGKTTNTIQKNHDYIIGYTLSKDIIFSQLDRDESSFDLEDEYVETRGKYKLTQTLDYNSLSYSASLDYPIVFDGRTFYPGTDKAAWEARQNGNHGQYDWAWRWSKASVEWGIKEGLLVLKGNRLYTKTYSKCRKKNGLNELEFIDSTKPYTTLSFMSNEYSNDNGKKELNKILIDGEKLFKNPKPSILISELIKMVCPKKDSITLDFFAGSGTTGEAVLKLNADDMGQRRFILCQINEITPFTPKGIPYDVTLKRLKRIMTGSCYDGFSDYSWNSENTPYGGSLEVCEIDTVANFESVKGKTPFEVIDETLYGMASFSTLREKVEWVCRNFDYAQRVIESDDEYIRRIEGE